jgi:hypothetical protein
MLSFDPLMAYERVVNASAITKPLRANIFGAFRRFLIPSLLAELR